MYATLKSLICQFLAVAMMMAPFQTGQAAMIGTDQVHSAAASSQANAERATVLNFMSRSQTISEFEAMGVDADTARQRVAAMSDAEVSQLAGQINAMPAGADGLVVLILVVFIIWYFAFRR